MKAIFLPVFMWLAAAALTWTGPAQAAAGKLMFGAGELTLRGAAGAERVPVRGDPIDVGDTLILGDGARAQLRFADGAMVSLQPGSRFRVDEYRFGPAARGGDRAYFTLLAGGLRTSTGKIGKADPADYRLAFPNGRIQPRGTSYSVLISHNGALVDREGTSFPDGTWYTVHSGAMEVTVEGSPSKLLIGTGETYFLAHGSVTPVAMPGGYQTLTSQQVVAALVGPDSSRAGKGDRTASEVMRNFEHYDDLNNASGLERAMHGAHPPMGLGPHGGGYGAHP